MFINVHIAMNLMAIKKRNMECLKLAIKIMPGIAKNNMMLLNCKQPLVNFQAK